MIQKATVNYECFFSFVIPEKMWQLEPRGLSVKISRFPEYTGAWFNERERERQRKIVSGERGGRTSSNYSTKNIGKVLSEILFVFFFSFLIFLFLAW